ncbi:C40 family peptidase [Pedobacter sp. AW31-3R]|uniref:C40 family peptidase n=1 Tax=Pedobacter sp. AW31-3R TaxID=3445781 RepID=UPI003F9F6383
MEQKYAICRVAVAPLRAAASDKAEITTQLLFGDHVEVLERAEPWYRIRTGFDDYEGWMDFKQLAVLTEQQYHHYDTCDELVPLGVDNTAIASDGSKYYLAPSSSLPEYANGYCTIGEEKFKLSFEPHLASAASPTDDVVTFALFFLNAPYLWGGRTLFGIDCSGFSQAVLKLAGIVIKRDAAQQAEQGTLVNFLQQVQPGDLAFFDNAEGRIIHVGIMLNAHEIIHASGRVRIDRIDDQGIYNAELGRYSHRLRIIKRFI